MVTGVAADSASPAPPPVTSLSERAAELLADFADCPAVHHDSGWSSWGDLAATAKAIDGCLAEAQIDVSNPVAVLMREKPSSVAALVGGFARRRCSVMLSPLAPDSELAADIARPSVDGGLAGIAGAVVAESADWARPGLLDAAASAGVLAIGIGGAASSAVLIGAGHRGGHRRSELAGIAATVLSSGTTGKPTRVSLSYSHLDAILGGGAPPDPRRSKGASINALPLVSIGGVLGVASTVWRGRPIALMERFDVHRWAELVAEHRPRRTGAPPAVMRMVLDAGIPAETFESVASFETGSAFVDPALAADFEAAYGVPVLQSYGATEFLSAVAGWTLEDHEQWAESKRGSVGRPVRGASVRVVDDHGHPLPSDEPGRLEAIPTRPSSGGRTGWIATNDRARIDEDGFVWILGRFDDVLIRGGFKVSAGEVERVLEMHESVAEAAVVGLDDPRLGQVPGAVVVPRAGFDLRESELIAHARENLAPYQVPVRIALVGELPRNSMMKVVRSAVVEALEAAGAKGENANGG